jgi:predicted sugar kinase
MTGDLTEREVGLHSGSREKGKEREEVEKRQDFVQADLTSAQELESFGPGMYCLIDDLEHT